MGAGFDSMVIYLTFFQNQLSDKFSQQISDSFGCQTFAFDLVGVQVAHLRLLY